MRKNIWEHFGEGKYLGTFWRGEHFGIILVRENIWDHFGEGK